jgi:hypothetical protein
MIICAWFAGALANLSDQECKKLAKNGASDSTQA